MLFDGGGDGDGAFTFTVPNVCAHKNCRKVHREGTRVDSEKKGIEKNGRLMGRRMCYTGSWNSFFLVLRLDLTFFRPDSP